MKKKSGKRLRASAADKEPSAEVTFIRSGRDFLIKARTKKVSQGFYSGQHVFVVLLTGFGQSCRAPWLVDARQVSPLAPIRSLKAVAARLNNQ